MSDFKAKMHKIRFPPGLCPRNRWQSSQRSPDPLAVFQGPTSKWLGRGQQDLTPRRKLELAHQGAAP